MCTSFVLFGTSPSKGVLGLSMMKEAVSIARAVFIDCVEERDT